MIDLEETVNPLGASNRSGSIRIKAENSASFKNTPTPKIIDEEDPIMDSDEELHPKMVIKPLDDSGEKDKSATAETAEMAEM